MSVCEFVYCCCCLRRRCCLKVKLMCVFIHESTGCSSSLPQSWSSFRKNMWVYGWRYIMAHHIILFFVVPFNFILDDNLIRRSFWLWYSPKLMVCFFFCYSGFCSGRDLAGDDDHFYLWNDVDDERMDDHKYDGFFFCAPRFVCWSQPTDTQPYKRHQAIRLLFPCNIIEVSFSLAIPYTRYIIDMMIVTVYSVSHFS